MQESTHEPEAEVMSAAEVWEDVSQLIDMLHQKRPKKDLAARAKRGSHAAYLAALAQVPDVEPEAYDRLPVLQEGYV